MTMTHAVIWLDHKEAQVIQFDAEHSAASSVKASTHPTRQHGSTVRTEHEFFGHVCDALVGAPRVLVVGTHTARDDFNHYVDKHRPETAKRVAGYETGDYPTANQLVAKARQYFLDRDGAGGTPPAK